MTNTPMPIYTRTGDDGTTALFGGKRVLKSDPLVDLYGSIDELNSWVGLVVTGIKDKKLREFLFAIQTDLFTIGSTLAGWKGDFNPIKPRVDEMEHWIDRMDKSLPRLTNFILPGGSQAGARIHITRNVCRRVERLLVSVSKKKTIDPFIIQYINRLSDLFFELARFINKQENVGETIWSGIPRRVNNLK